MMNENKGTIVQVMGPVVDVAFPGGKLPEIKEALQVELDGQRQVMEVVQSVGDGTVRCIMLSPSEGLGRGMAVTATGAPISVPVGDGVLGRMFNVLGIAGGLLPGPPAAGDPGAPSPPRSEKPPGGAPGPAGGGRARQDAGVSPADV